MFGNTHSGDCFVSLRACSAPAQTPYRMRWNWELAIHAVTQYAVTHIWLDARRVLKTPHSPKILGIRRVLWGGVFFYVTEAKNAETIARYGHGAPSDWLERRPFGKDTFRMALPRGR